MVNISVRQQSNWDKQFQLKVIHGYSKFDEETLTSQDRLQLVPKQQYAQRNIGMTTEKKTEKNQFTKMLSKAS